MGTERKPERSEGARAVGSSARSLNANPSSDETSPRLSPNATTERTGGLRSDSNRDFGKLWEKFWATSSRSVRNDLIERHLYLVDEVVRRIPSRIAAHWSTDDLRSFGILGLINAVDRRQPELARIPFAIYDELRKLDWLPRTVRRRSIEFNKTEDDLRIDLRIDLRRSPNRAEILAAMDITDLRRTAATVSAIQRSQITSLDSPIRREAEGSLLDSLSESNNTEADVIRRLDHDALRIAMSTLPERQRSVIEHRFVDQLSLRETRARVGISESRTRQVEIDALRGLRHRLTASNAA